MKNVIGYYSTNVETNSFCVTDTSELIICGSVSDFPPQPDGYKFVEFTFQMFLSWPILSDRKIALNRSAMDNLQKIFYQFAVDTMAINAKAMLGMTEDEFCVVHHNFNN